MFLTLTPEAGVKVTFDAILEFNHVVIGNVTTGRIIVSVPVPAFCMVSLQLKFTSVESLVISIITA